MKQMLLIIAAIFCAMSVYGQRGKVAAASSFLDQGDVDGAKKRISDALVNEKSIDWARTYVIAGRVSVAEYLQTQNPEKVVEAADHFIKAIERDKLGDEKGKGIGKTANEIKLYITQNMPDIQNAGVEAYTAEKFDLSMRIFERVALLLNDPIFYVKGQPEVADSIFTYYTALSAYKSENWKKAVEYFNKSIDVGFDEGNAVLLLYEVYGAMKDTVNMVSTLQKGSDLFPDDDRIILNLINLYITMTQLDEALNYLDGAIAKNPNNATFYFARGYINESKNLIDEAVKDYLKSLELKDDLYDPLFSLGVIYFNKGAEKTREANDLADMKEYEAAIAQSVEFFSQALPFVERADKVKPDNEMVLDTLKSIYYRLQQMDKYEEVNEKLENLKK
ncbi:MAG: tetratricopeptide repeat protein [Marinilabiliaceae bacterium]|nr:tetratricopeptide repeat protein [Marinilabiliaceae bacterium]